MIKKTQRAGDKRETTPDTRFFESDYWRTLRVPFISTALVLILAIVYVAALRADAMWLCAVLWIPIALAAGTFIVSAIRTSRKH